MPDATTPSQVESAARDMDAMVQLADSLPRFASIIADPKAAKLPEGVGAYFLLAFSLAARADEKNLEAIMAYVERFEQFEATALFVSTLASNKNKVGMACKDRAFTKKCSEIGKFF